MDLQQKLSPRSFESAPMVSPREGRLTPYSERCPDSSQPTLSHCATLEEALLMTSCREAQNGHPEDPEKGASVRAASAHPEELGDTLVLSSRAPSPTLTRKCP